jgi:hypothetical protein
LICALLSQDKIPLVWLKQNSAHKSSHSGRHNVYTASRRSSLHTAAEDPQLLESGKSGSARIHRTVAESLKWASDYVVKICSERRLLECANWLTRQIFIRKINIREEICYFITAYLNRVCEICRFCIIIWFCVLDGYRLSIKTWG